MWRRCLLLAWELAEHLAGRVQQLQAAAALVTPLHCQTALQRVPGAMACQLPPKGGCDAAACDLLREGTLLQQEAAGQQSCLLSSEHTNCPHDGPSNAAAGDG